MRRLFRNMHCLKLVWILGEWKVNSGVGKMDGYTKYDLFCSRLMGTLHLFLGGFSFDCLLARSPLWGRIGKEDQTELQQAMWIMNERDDAGL